MVAELTLTNRSEQEWFFDKWLEDVDKFGHAGNVRFVVLNKQRQQAKYVHVEQIKRQIVPYTRSRLKPGESVKLKITLNKWHDLSKPGTYTVHATYTSKGPFAMLEKLPMWEGKLRSNKIQVAVEEPIDLGKKNIQFEGHKSDDVKSGLLPVGLYDTTDLQSAKTVYLKRRAGNFPAGPPFQELVGRVPFAVHGFPSGGAKMIVSRYERRGNRISAVIKYVPSITAGKQWPENTAYLRAILPSDLPAGKYRVDIKFGSYGQNDKGDLNALPCTPLPGLTCEFTVPAPLETLHGTIIEKPWTKSFESWNAGGSEYYVLKDGNVQLRPSDAVPFEQFKKFKDKQVIIQGRRTEGTPYIPPADSDEQLPGPHEVDGKPAVLMRGRGFAVHKIRLAKKPPPRFSSGVYSDVKRGSDLGLERFQAQPKWVIPV